MDKIEIIGGSKADLIEALKRAVEGGDDSAGGMEHDSIKLKMLPEAATMELTALYERYGKCPFKPGDFVHPRLNTALKGHGVPHVVLEVRAPGDEYTTSLPTKAREDMPTGATEPAADKSEYGSRLDVRVGVIYEAEKLPKPVMLCFWMESWALEPYPSVEGQGA